MGTRVKGNTSVDRNGLVGVSSYLSKDYEEEEDQEEKEEEEEKELTNCLKILEKWVRVRALLFVFVISSINDLNFFNRCYFF